MDKVHLEPASLFPGSHAHERRWSLRDTFLYDPSRDVLLLRIGRGILRVASRVARARSCETPSDRSVRYISSSYASHDYLHRRPVRVHRP